MISQSARSKWPLRFQRRPFEITLTLAIDLDAFPLLTSLSWTNS